MIISASYRTDIPAFYGDWFIARLDAGYCRTINPFSRQIHTVRLDRQAVSGFVFWTKNLGPFWPALQLVRDRGFPFVVQFTINAYPRSLETSVTDAERAIGHMRDLASEFGSRAGVWRYDPVVATSVTPPNWHVENFARLRGDYEPRLGEITARVDKPGEMKAMAEEAHAELEAWNRKKAYLLAKA